MFDFLKTLPKAAARITRAVALFAKADLDFVALTDEGVAEDALSKLLEQRRASAVEVATADLRDTMVSCVADRDESRASLDEAEVEKALLTSRLAAVNVSLARAGLPVVDGAASFAGDFAAALAQQISAGAAERLAESGVPVAELPAVTDEIVPSAQELRSQFAGMTDAKERGAFYAKHKDKLLS